MDSLILAASTVVPLIVYLVTGGAIRKAGILDEETMRKLNGMIFKVPLPLSLFFDIYSADLRTAVQPRLLLGTFLLICAFFAILDT